MRFEKGLIIIEGADQPVNRQNNRRFCKVFTIPLGMGIVTLAVFLNFGELQGTPLGILGTVIASLVILLALYFIASLFYLGWLRKDSSIEVKDEKPS